MAKRSVNQELLDSAIVNELILHGQAQEMALEIARVLRDEVLPDLGRHLMAADLSDLRLNDIRLMRLQEEIRRGLSIEKITSETMAQLTAIASNTVQAAFDELTEALPVNFGLTMPGPNMLNAIIFEQPFNGKIMSEWFSQLGETVQSDIFEAFRVGMIEGKNIPQMANDLLAKNYDAFTTGGVNKAVNNAKAVARTAANYVSNQSRLAFAVENSDVIKGVEYIAVLDDRTSEICMLLHGTVYPVNDIGAVPPQHYNCRSTMGYVTKSWDELEMEGNEIVKQQAFRPEGSTRMDGVIERPESFDDWIKTQSPERQNKLLGPVRAELYRSGAIPDISGFAAADGSFATLKDLGYSRTGVKL